MSVYAHNLNTIFKQKQLDALSASRRYSYKARNRSGSGQPEPEKGWPEHFRSGSGFFLNLTWPDLTRNIFNLTWPDPDLTWPDQKFSVWEDLFYQKKASDPTTCQVSSGQVVSGPFISGRNRFQVTSGQVEYQKFRFRSIQVSGFSGQVSGWPDLFRALKLNTRT